MRLSRFVPALFFVSIMVGWGGVGLGQETDTKWLVGLWEGTQTVGPFETRVTVEFKGGGNSWELEIASGSCSLSKARGSAKVSGNVVEMKGEYYQTYEPCRPTYLSYSLTRAGDVLEGTGIGSSNSPFGVSWKKAK